MLNDLNPTSNQTQLNSFDNFKSVVNGVEGVSAYKLYKFSQRTTSFSMFIKYYARKLNFNHSSLPKYKSDVYRADLLMGLNSGFSLYNNLITRGKVSKITGDNTFTVNNSVDVQEKKKYKQINPNRKKVLTTLDWENTKEYSLKDLEPHLSKVMVENGHDPIYLEDYTNEAGLLTWNTRVTRYDNSKENICKTDKEVITTRPTLIAIVEEYASQGVDGINLTKKGYDYLTTFIVDEDAVYGEWKKLVETKLYTDVVEEAA